MCLLFFTTQRSSVSTSILRMESIIKLIISLVLTFILVLAELTLGHFTHCLTLLVVTNQSIHNLINLASSTASKKLETYEKKRWTYGYSRIPVLGLIGSQIFLFSMCFATTVETLQTLFHIDHLDVMHTPGKVCILAGIHFGIWVVTFLLIGGNTNHQMGILSAMNDIGKEPNPWYFVRNFRIDNFFRDLSSCFALMTATGIIMLLSLYSVNPKYIIYVDPCFALVTILVLLFSQCSFMKILCKTILQGHIESCPSFLKNKENFQKYLINKFPSVLSVHEFHHWYLTPSKDVITCHIIFKDTENGSSHFQELTKYLDSNHGHVAIQPEFLNVEECFEHECHYICKNTNCNPKTCCPIRKETV
ncbi:uncharacterized protein [Lepeophtheirus salmonis]|nr:cadmium, cobalt and zinc/H(+)-K(+) antiporter-like [Lepeophtheirus salmonis]